MNGYGNHPTQYGNLSNDALYAMFRESTYSRLSESEKLDLLQETVNRDAMERGELGSPLVQAGSLPGNVYGKEGNGVITVNQDVLMNGIQTVQVNGETFQNTVADYNVQALNTVLHENAHAFQDQMNSGTVPANEHAAEYQANDFHITAVSYNGNYQLGSQYLTGETPGGYYFYYFQPTERDAHKEAEVKTSAILNGISSRYGTERSFQAYAKSLAANGYQATEQEAVRMSGNPNFVKDLSQTLQNQFYGTNVPVNPDTEQAVKAEMIATCQARLQQANHLNTKAQAETTMDARPVTLEAYNQSLSNTNAAAMQNNTGTQPGTGTENGMGAYSASHGMGAYSASQGIGADSADGMETGGAYSTNQGIGADSADGMETGGAYSASQGIGTDSADYGIGDGGASDPSMDNDTDGLDGGEDAGDGMDL